MSLLSSIVGITTILGCPHILQSTKISSSCEAWVFDKLESIQTCTINLYMYCVYLHYLFVSLGKLSLYSLCIHNKQCHSNILFIFQKTIQKLNSAKSPSQPRSFGGGGGARSWAPPCIYIYIYIYK